MMTSRSKNPARPITVCMLALSAILSVFTIVPSSALSDEEPARLRSRTVRIPASEPWIGTDFILTEGDEVVIQASGKAATVPETFSGPNGQPYHCNDSCSFPEGQFGQLIAKIGIDGRPFPIGEKSTFASDADGELFLGVNDCCNWNDNWGAFDASISAASRR